jgi:FkbM family methyltransferase
MSESLIPDLTRFGLLCTNVAQLESHRLVTDRPIWIFGAGQFGRDVCSALTQEGYLVHGFVESKPRDEKLLGLPVRSWSQLQTDQLTAQLVIGIFNRGMPFDELELLAQSAGFTDIFMPWHLYAQMGASLGWRFWLSSTSVIIDSQAAIERVYRNLADEESRRCLLSICEFRLGQHNAYASFTHSDRQYFNDLTLRPLAGQTNTVVDGGAYNGDTFLELAGKIEVSGAYLFEPDPNNFQELTHAVKMSPIAAVCLPLAISDHYRILSFNAGNGEGGSISEQGKTHIAAVALDELLQGIAVTFLKLDVEGAEIAALHGASELIKRYRPVMAISLYHKPQDLWEIPEYLLQICENYDFYIRQHYFNSFDSVLYAIPV